MSGKQDVNGCGKQKDVNECGKQDVNECGKQKDVNEWQAEGRE